MPNIAQQYFDPFYYNAVDVPADSAPVTLRAAILALSGGAVPPNMAGVVAFAIVPDVATRVIGGYDRKRKEFVAAAAGGGYELIDADTKTGFDISDPLDSVKISADDGTPGTCTLILYRGVSPS